MGKTTNIAFGNPSGGIKYLFEWSRTLWKPSNEVKISLDFSDFIFVKPFDVIFVVNQINLYKEKFPAAEIIIQGLESNKFAEKMGLSNYLLPEEFPHDNVEESDFILPLTILKRSEFRAPGEGPQNNHEAIERQAGVLAEHLTMSTSGAVYDTVQYSLREIIRNIFEHTSSDTISYAARYTPNSQIAEICVSDNGSGIHNSLRQNKKFGHLNSKEALEWSCLPGVSGNPKVYEQKAGASVWENSGYGLYMMTRLCKNKGDFFILSNEDALYLQSNKTYFKVPNNYGTIVRLHINIKKITDLQTELKKYAEEGRKLAQTIKGAAHLPASMASMKLGKDFS